MKRRTKPWGNGAFTLIVFASGAIIGRSSPDLDALCRDDPPESLYQAHCKIASEEDRFFLCDLTGLRECTTLLDGFPVNDGYVGPLRTGSLLAVGPLRIKVQLSDMAKGDPIADGHSLKRPSEDEEGGWQSMVYKKTAADSKMAVLKQQQEYKDRAEMRRNKCKGEAGSAAIDGLVRKFEQIRQAEEMAAETEDSRVEMPLMEAHREGNMGIDGTFLGGGGNERAGIGFHSTNGPELIPNVIDPRSLSPQEASRLKTQMRFQSAR